NTPSDETPERMFWLQPEKEKGFADFSRARLAESCRFCDARRWVRSGESFVPSEVTRLDLLERARSPHELILYRLSPKVASRLAGLRRSPRSSISLYPARYPSV